MERGISPVVGVVLLVGLTIVLSASVVIAVETRPPDPPPAAELSVSVDPATDQFVVTHHAGDPIDVRNMNVTVEIGGEPLRHQPPIPFFAARGFESGPEGPFNRASPHGFHAGETASFRLAETNSPELTANRTVTVTIATERSVLYRETL